MIERFINNDLNIKRYRRFKAHKFSVISIWVIVFFSALSFTAEFWANSKPIYLKYKGESFFPVFNKYNPLDFDIRDSMVVDYRQLKLVDSD